MARRPKQKKAARRRYSDEFKSEALALARNIGVTGAAQLPHVKYPFMDSHRGEFAITIMGRVLKVSRSGFYLWRGQPSTSPRSRHRQLLDERVKAVFDKHKSRYGAPRIAKELAELGHPYDEKTVSSSGG